MEAKINVFVGRTMILPVSFGEDVSADTITSEIREDLDVASTLIASWVVTFESDGTDGEVVFTLDDAVTTTITQFKGYMDIKRIVGGEPFNVLDEPIEVFFRKSITS